MTDNSNLSAREKEILGLVAEGLTNREIAQRLSISHNTVKVHLSNIFEKIGAASRTEATVFAIEHRIVDVPGGETPAAPEDDGLRRLTLQSIWVLGSALFLIAIFGIVIGGRLFYQNPSPGTVSSIEQADRWQELAPMPEVRIGMAAVAYDNQIYAIAGEGPAGVSGSVFRYDIETDMWDRLLDKPTPVTDVDGVLIGEKIYIPGGRLADGQPTDVLEIYDPRRNTWETGAPLPEALSAYALADFEGKLYLFGGWDGKKVLDSVLIFDPQLNQWFRGLPLDYPIYGAEAVARPDKIIIAGGKTADDTLSNKVWSYFPVRDSQGEEPWSIFTDLPFNFNDFGLANIYNTIYVMGDVSTSDNSDVLYNGYVFSEGVWTPINFEQTIINRVNTVLISDNSFIYVFNTSEIYSTTSLWSYKAFYFEIYVPFYK